MLKRTLFFTNPFRLSLKHKQLVAEEKETAEIRTVPVEDIGFVVLDNMQISISLPLIEALTENNAAVIFCDRKHHPQSMLLNLEGNNIQTEIFRHQVEAGLPLKKKLWKQTVEAKINNQARLLEKLDIETYDIQALAKDVKSGDTANREGAAARIYWQRLMGKDFYRHRYGKYPNELFNYAYMILRAAVARALTGSGLLPGLGIHHKNKYNAYCLADDIMEPYRPFADRLVYNIYERNPEGLILEKEHKAEILKILTEDVYMDSGRRPLIIALSNTTASLAKCFSGESKIIKYPELR